MGAMCIRCLLLRETCRDCEEEEEREAAEEEREREWYRGRQMWEVESWR